MTDQFTADTDDLRAFADSGRGRLASLAAISQLIAFRRSWVGRVLGDGPTGESTGRALAELHDRLAIGNVFAETIADALEAFEPADPDGDASRVRVDQRIVATALREVGLVTTGHLTPGAADRLAGRLDQDGLADDGPLATVAATHRSVVADIDRGDDLGITNGELNRVRDHLAELDQTGVELVFAQLTDAQLERLFHNVHSSGFWSNDWDDRERTEFYDLLAPLSSELKIELEPHSPYLGAWGAAEQAATARGAPTALANLVGSDGVTGRLDFEEREALLRQAANYPTPTAIGNLSRLADHGWFDGMSLDDQQRTAKMIGHLSSHHIGDRTVIDNTLDHFLAPDAPYRFDWDKDGTAYGSAGGGEFHLNRRYLDAGDDPVSRSIPAGIDADDTEHMVLHTVAHEVNHLVNDDRVDDSFEYFMAEYRAYWVGHVSQFGAPPTRGDVEGRVRYLLTASDGAYRHIASAVDDPVEGPKIADFATGIVGRPVTASDLVVEIRAGVTDPDDPAPTPIPVDDGPNSTTNAPIEDVP
ncbi:MAG: hypothetical protein AAGA93_11630 [Actinomycetota bacterium]